MRETAQNRRKGRVTPQTKQAPSLHGQGLKPGGVCNQTWSHTWFETMLQPKLNPKPIRTLSGVSFFLFRRSRECRAEQTLTPGGACDSRPGPRANAPTSTPNTTRRQRRAPGTFAGACGGLHCGPGTTSAQGGGAGLPMVALTATFESC